MTGDFFSDPSMALEWSEKLLAVAVLLQTVEMLQLRPAWSEQGVWRWQTLRRDFQKFPQWMQSGLSACLSTRVFTFILWIRLLCAILVLAISSQPVLLGAIFLSTWLIAIRWRGTFNGGSDSITAITALALWVASLFPFIPGIGIACLGYIAIQSTLSYFVAGWVKLKNPDWRSGQILPTLLRTPGYPAPPWAVKIFDRSQVARWSGILIISFECLFPIVWIHPLVCLSVLSGTLCFHILNSWVFGLNRFVFAWLATYPAIYFWSGRL